MSRRATLALLPLLHWQAVAQAAGDGRPMDTRWQVDYRGNVEIGLDTTSEQNRYFGRYNGSSDDDARLFANLDWLASTADGRWDLQATEIGTDVGFGSLSFDGNGMGFSLEFESSYQANGEEGRSPFRGGTRLSLPPGWVAGNDSSGFTALQGNMREVDLHLERDRMSFSFHSDIGAAWRLETALAFEEKSGIEDLGAAIYTDASAGHAAILPTPVEYETLDFDLSLGYAGKQLLLDGSFFYRDFSNDNPALTWQNPYAVFGPRVAYPGGNAALALAPDNTYSGGRLLATWIINRAWRVQVNGSYAVTEQDDDFIDYTANPSLTVEEDLPAVSGDGDMKTGTMDTRVFYRPSGRLSLEAWWHGERRNRNGTRHAWRPVPGDAGDQVRPALAVYNSGHDYTVNRAGIKGTQQLPWHSRLTLDYEYENFERENAAVDETKQDRYTLQYRLPLWEGVTTRLELAWADRRASTYQWDQSYYALLDSALINDTPDNQRYITHPALSQFYLANRERSDARLDIDWQPLPTLNLALNLLWREDDYDKTELGLALEETTHAGLTLSWLPAAAFSLSAWAALDETERDQHNRSFRGGIEKNAFAVNPPLPQASDPARNWSLANQDEAVSLGLNLAWQIADNLEISADYSLVNSTSDYDFSDGGADDLASESLPGNDKSDQHHLVLQGAWHLREALSITVNYEYWSFEREDWAIRGLGANDIDKVLTLGEPEADEDLHYIGTSITYRWE